MADFTPRMGKAIKVQAMNGSIELVLDQAQELPGSIRQGGSFRLEFQGPLQPTLGQGIYRFLIGGQSHEIFIVPIAQTPQGMRYEAVFY